MKLAVIIGTTRTGRNTDRLAKWVAKTAKTVPEVKVDLIDLADFSLPIFNEPVSPRYNPDRKIDRAVKPWLDRLRAADAYIFVTAEYNHSVPGVLKNAIDYVTWEMEKKPVTVVSHGSVGGARATMHLKEILSESRAAVIPAAVAFHGSVTETIDEQGNLDKELMERPYGSQSSLINALTELKWYSDSLEPARLALQT